MSLGIHMLLGETLLELLRRVEAGEGAEAVFIEIWANADHVSVDDLTEGDEDGLDV